MIDTASHSRGMICPKFCNAHTGQWAAAQRLISKRCAMSAIPDRGNPRLTGSQVLMIPRDRAMRRHVVIDPASNKNNSFGRNAGFGICTSDVRATRNREASMNRRLAGMVVTMGVGVSALVGTASAQQSPGGAALDSGLRAAVERKDVPGVVALVTDRDRVLYQGAFGVADVATG